MTLLSLTGRASVRFHPISSHASLRKCAASTGSLLGMGSWICTLSSAIGQTRSHYDAVRLGPSAYQGNARERRLPARYTVTFCLCWPIGRSPVLPPVQTLLFTCSILKIKKMMFSPAAFFLGYRFVHSLVSFFPALFFAYMISLHERTLCN